MFMQEGEPEVARVPALGITAAVTAVASVVLFIFSGPLFAWASQALLRIF